MTGRVYGPSFSPDGSLVAAAWVGEGIVRVLDRSTGAVKGRSVQVGDGNTELSPDGRQLAVGPVEGAIEVLDAPLASPRRLVRRGRDRVIGLWGSGFAYSPDGRWLAAGGCRLDRAVSGTSPPASSATRCRDTRANPRRSPGRTTPSTW